MHEFLHWIVWSVVFSVFHIAKDDKREANFLSYSKNDEKFYLAVKKDSEVQLRVSKWI